VWLYTMWLYKDLTVFILCCKRLADYITIVRRYGNKNLYIIANSYHKLEYLNISNYIKFSKILICNVIHSCLRLQ